MAFSARSNTTVRASHRRPNTRAPSRTSRSSSAPPRYLYPAEPRPERSPWPRRRRRRRRKRRRRRRRRRRRSAPPRTTPRTSPTPRRPRRCEPTSSITVHDRFRSRSSFAQRVTRSGGARRDALFPIITAAAARLSGFPPPFSPSVPCRAPTPTLTLARPVPIDSQEEPEVEEANDDDEDDGVSPTANPGSAGAPPIRQPSPSRTNFWHFANQPTPGADLPTGSPP